MSNFKLTEGSLAQIMSGGTVDDPVMQVLGSKKIMGNADKERYRLLVSDGKYQISFAMIATQINEKITSGELTSNSVIKVKKYITSMINSGGKGDRRVMVILDMDILCRGEEVGGRIGNPIALPDDPSSVLKQNGNPSSSVTNGTGHTPSTVKATPNPPAPKRENSYQPPKATPQPEDLSGSMSSQLTVPIANLSPYQNKWVIKARVINKSPIRSWSNSRGEGQLFSMDLADESGEIRATAFRDLVAKFYELIEIDKVYYISKCQLKLANKKFTNLNNDFEMTLTSDTTITPCYDDVSVPQTQFNFVPVDKITTKEVGDIIDVLGVCKSAADCQIIHTKSTNRELKKREVTLVDQSNNSICLTLWGAEAESFNGNDQPILAIRGAKVGEFGGGKNLSVLVSSVMKINPDIPDAHRLKGWFDNVGKTTEAVNISARTGSGNMRTDWMTIQEVKEKRLGSGEQADYYQCKATILLVNSTNALYKACPLDECNKKVMDLENGQYRCEKCNKEYDRFKYRMIMSMNIGDWSDNQWVSMFAGEAEKILQMTSQELGEITENEKEALSTICSKAHFTEHIFRCRAKMETYNDETRLKSVVMRVDPINYKDYHSYLISSIKNASGL